MQIDDVVEIVAGRLNLNKGKVMELARLEFKFLHEQMQSGEFKNIQLLHLGKFYCNEKRKKYWEERLKQESNDLQKDK